MIREPRTDSNPIERGQPLRDAVYSRIAGQIVSGEHRPGAAITEAALSRSLQVSRTPVREALLRLEAEGVLESALARGFIVKPLSLSELADLYPVLANLEGLAVELATRSGSLELDKLSTSLDELESCDDPVLRWKLDTRFHDLIVMSSGNAYLHTLTTQIRTSLSRYELTYMRAVPSRESADLEHRSILEAISRGDNRLARARIEDHWLNGMTLVSSWITDTPDAFL